ncbi:MAG: hypothetical protein IK149_01785 [Oscillospiraceae bacterium]|nr:hypothetical protein [Oscillospiraceae bacterium]
MTREKALALRALIEKAAVSLADGDALGGVELFPAWKNETAYVLGDRIRYEAKLYKCAQAHTSQPDWTPPDTPALWTEVAEPGTIPVWRQPTGSQDAYNKGDRVWYPAKDTTVYESLMDNNVYSPEAYPAGWRQI